MAPDGSAFDYVIVGAGSAGCVLAEALSRQTLLALAVETARNLKR